jgi:hypothetical protein
MRELRFGGLLAALLLLGAAGQVRGDFISTTLGSAGPGNFAILNIGTGNADVALNGPGTTTGNVGVLSGTLSLASSTPPAVAGNVLLGNGAKPNFSAAKQVSGNVLTGQSSVLNQARTDAIHASSTFASLGNGAPNLGAITSSTTINAAPNANGVTVANVSGINLGGGQALTLNGPKGSQFVINDSGGLTLNSGKINLTGGVTPSDVVLNFTGTNPALKTSGGLHHESVVNGTLLGPGAGTTVDFSPGLIKGEIIAGGNHAHFVSGAEVKSPGPPDTAPEPSSVVLMGLGLVGVAGAHHLKRRRRSGADGSSVPAV